VADGKSESSSSFESNEWPVPIEEEVIELEIELLLFPKRAWF
jgi:hypothetical protein